MDTERNDLHLMAIALALAGIFIVAAYWAGYDNGQRSANQRALSVLADCVGALELATEAVNEIEMEIHEQIDYMPEVD